MIGLHQIANEEVYPPIVLKILVPRGYYYCKSTYHSLIILKEKIWQVILKIKLVFQLRLVKLMAFNFLFKWSTLYYMSKNNGVKLLCSLYLNYQLINDIRYKIWLTWKCLDWLAPGSEFLDDLNHDPLWVSFLFNYWFHEHRYLKVIEFARCYFHGLIR